MWVRGLKHAYKLYIKANSESHPMWVRGLKPDSGYFQGTSTDVAPYVGAWIETPYN